MKALILSIFVLFYSNSNAQIQVIHNFEGGYKGSYPIGNLHLIGDVLYGCTFGDLSLRDIGNIFKVDTDGLVYESILPFNDSLGNSPECIILHNNILYGNTKFGGKSEYGSLFKYDISKSKFTNLYEFDKINNNSTPDNKLILLDSFLYGVAGGGSFVSDSGSLFKIKLDGTQYKKIFEFKNPAAQGIYPLGPLVKKNNNLYGVTQKGGKYNYGALYQMDISGNNSKILNHFDTFSRISFPLASPILIDTSFYGVVGYMAINAIGYIYKISISGKSIKKIFLPDSISPSHNLVYKNGFIYGTSISGGINKKGSLFRIRLADETITYLNDFNGYNGAEPLGELLLDDKFIYGTTSKGGTKNLGVVFKFEYCTPYKKEQAFLLNIGDSVRVNGKFYKKPTTFVDSLYTINGCDSIISTKILSKSQLTSLNQNDVFEWEKHKTLITLKPKITAPISIHIHNLMGQMVYHLENTKNSEINIDLALYPKGVYIIQLEIAQNNYRFKISND